MDKEVKKLIDDRTVWKIHGLETFEPTEVPISEILGELIYMLGLGVKVEDGVIKIGRISKPSIYVYHRDMPDGR